MVDFHTHILPEIDDGAKNIKESITLLEEAKEAGFEKVILTSHYIEEYYETNVEKRKEITNEVCNFLKKKENNVSMYLGNEIFLTDNLVNLLKNQKASTINDSRYILFELPFNSKPLNLENMIYDILKEEFIPVLAHPERYSFVKKNPNVIYDLIDYGVLMQCNFGSFIGKYGKAAQIIMKKMLENNMVHFLGSDVHRTKSIYKQIPKILNGIIKLIGEEQTRRITTINPEIVLKNEKLEIKEPKQIRLSWIEKLKIKE